MHTEPGEGANRRTTGGGGGPRKARASSAPRTERGSGDTRDRGGLDRRANGGRTANLLGALALEAVGAQEAATHGVVGQAGAAAAALVTIAARPGRSIEQLRAPLGLSQPGAVRLVERLVGGGWVERAGGGGRRGLELRLTARGERVLDHLLVARRAALAELLEPLSEREQAQLARLLEKLLGARSGDRADLERLCRLCEWRVCRRCPVAGAVGRGPAPAAAL